MEMLVRSAVTHEESTRMLREFVTEQMLGRLAAGMDTADRASADNRDRRRRGGADPAAVPDRIDRMTRYPAPSEGEIVDGWPLSHAHSYENKGDHGW